MLPKGQTIMSEFFSFFQSHWDELLLIIGTAVTLASLIVKLTPTPKDDEILAKVIKFLDVIAINPKRQQ
jgi:hypothetical protein